MAIIQFPHTCGVENILQTLSVPVCAIEPDNKTLFKNEFGVTYKVPDKNQYMVSIRRGLSVKQKQETLCHELGHIVLGHMTKGKFPHMTEEQREREAAQFASFILPMIYQTVFVGGSNE